MIAEKTDYGVEAVKQMMMEMGFSGKTPSCDVTKAFIELFPNVVKQIKLFKKINKKKKNDGQQEKGTEMFSILLAQYESEIVVDNILPNLYSLGLFVLTKHDSVICKRSELDKVLDVMTLFFRHIQFDCTVRADGTPVTIRAEADGAIQSSSCEPNS
jgi:hypothetical protein